MSQSSNGSDTSLPLSEDTFSELSKMMSQDEKKIMAQIDDTIEQHQDYQLQYYNPQPSCSNLNSAGFEINSGESRTTSFNDESSSSLATYTVLSDIRPRAMDEDFPGRFDFDIGFEPQKEPAPRASPWIFSNKLRKLYAKRNVDIPVRIMLNHVPTGLEVFHSLKIRVTMAYSSVEHSRCVVKRCPNHVSNSEVSGQHMVEISRTDAVYGLDQSLRHILTIPINTLEPGRNYKLEFIRFMCQNTCPGGPDRRPFHAVFTLLFDDEVIGVKTLKTKICSTPGRTRDNEEKVLGMPRKVSSSSVNGPVHRKKLRVEAKASESQVEASSSRESPTSTVNQGVPGRVVEVQDPPRIKEEKKEDDELYTIQVRGRDTYEYLMRAKEAYELSRMVPNDVLQRYRASCPPCGPNWYLLQSNKTSTVSQVQPVTSDVGTISTNTATNHSSTTVSTVEARYTLKNVLMRKKRSTGLKHMKGLTEAGQ